MYSTNYELPVYWALMADGPYGFRDLFFSDAFDLENTDTLA